MKYLTTIAAMLLLAATSIIAQEKTEEITLPFSLCNKTQWQAVETSIAFGDEEELLAYELKDFAQTSGEVRSGQVFYVPSAVDDRVLLLFKNVQIASSKLPYLIDVKDSRLLFIHFHGYNVLKTQGTVIRSNGDVNIYGQPIDEGTEMGRDNTLVMSGGRKGHAIVEVGGGLYFENLILDMGDNKAQYGFICTGSNEKEQHDLELNNVTGTVAGLKDVVAGFRDIVVSDDTDVKGITPTMLIINEEDQEEIDPASDDSDEGQSNEIE